MTTDFGDLASRPSRAFAAEPLIEGNRWWPSDPERPVDLYQAGAVMISAERAEADRELEARARRSATPPVLRREDVVFDRSSIPPASASFRYAAHMEGHGYSGYLADAFIDWFSSGSRRSGAHGSPSASAPRVPRSRQRAEGAGPPARSQPSRVVY